MVAGMVMPLDNLKAIYEHLFRDGVIVAKKDKRPQTKHPEIPGVDNLQVIRAMGSLKSRGYVRETFAWKHYYWYLTNEGIVYLRDYLHLPPEIVPTPLQRVRRPAATLAIACRADRVQAVQGPTSYVPKPGKMGAEMQEAFLDRQAYRRKTATMDEAEMTESSERTPRFRGRPMASTQSRPKGSWDSKEQPMRSDARDYTREMEPSVRRKVTMQSASQMPPIETYHVKPVEQEKMAELKECTKTAFVQKTQKVHPSPDVPTISSKVGATAVESSLLAVHTEAVKEKPKQEVPFKVSHETAAGESKTAKDARHPTPSKPKVEKTQKTLVTKNVQDMPAVSSAKGTIAVESSLFSVHTEAVKEKPKEGEFVKVFQQTTSTLIGDSKTSKDAPRPTPSKQEEEKIQKTTVVKNVQDVSSTVEATVDKSSVSSVTTETAKEKPKEESKSKVKKTQQATVTKNVQDVSIDSSAVKTAQIKEKPKEEVCIKVSQSTLTGDSKIDKDASASKTKVEKTQKTAKTKNLQDIPIVSSTAVESSVFSVSAEAVKEKPKEEVLIKDSSKTAKDASLPTPSKSKAEKTQKTQVEKTQKTKTVQDVPAVSSAVETTAVKSSVSTEAVKEKPLEEVCVSVSQETTPKGGGKKDKDAACPVPSKPKTEKMQKTIMTKDVQDIPSMETPAVQSSVVSVSTEAVKEKSKEEVCINVSVETTSTSYSKKIEDAPHPSPSKPKVETTQKTMLAQNVQEQPIKKEKADVTIALHDVPAVHADETKSSTSISTQVPVKSLKPATPLEKTKDVQEASKDDHTKVHEKVEIPCAISAAEVKAEVKGRKPEPNPESQSLSTGAEVKITAADSSKTSEVVAQTPKKFETNKDSDSVQQQPSPAKLTEEPIVTAAKDGDTEDASKPSKGKKKKHKSASKTSAVKQVSPPTAETKVIEVKTENAGQVDLLKVEVPEQVTTNDSAKTSPEGMHAVESTQPTAVQNEAPAHKGEVEPAQPSAEKREVLKGKTSSSQRQWEAPAASASAAASAQLTPLPEQGEPPSVAQHTPAPDTQQSAEKQHRLSDTKAPVITGPLPADENTCDAQQQSLDDAMRKKIVVVEEVIEVQQIASPVAGQPVTPPVPEIAGDDLDYDVLEELAIERGVLQGPVEETCWDHSLQEPEGKTFPNFIEGMTSFQFFH
ncbi:hypothetical protein Q8A67_008208 [Cirrhinus molitorella]|uniref:Plectin/eS10 N-terminal domain-containing protein n=1 Tax=Cirrhinus molitorella TaxID=172907 RepID=A0AA88Q8S1_9TELE|nr:hypothetical protein Q8A67_008208 [Cirrhinus molitorella]